MTDKDKLDAIITDLANDLKPVVQKIEEKLPITKGHYGDYLGLFSALSRGDRRMGKIICAALLVAGANHDGVASAYKISFGSAPHAYGRQ